MSPRSSPLLLCLSYKTAPEEVALIKPSSPLEVPMAYTRFHSRPSLFTTNTSFILFVCVLVEHFASPSCGLTKQLNTATQAQPWASTLRLLPCPKVPLGYFSYLVATLSLTGVTGLFLSTKHGLGLKKRTTECVYKNSFRKVKLRETDSGLA